MSANEISLHRESKQHSLFNTRTLGISGMIGAPMLLVETLLRIADVLPQDSDNALIGLLEMIYMAGWLAAAIGMRRLRVTGDGKASRVLFLAQIAGLLLAFLFAVQVILGASYNDPAATLFFRITDLAFPFSHLLMIIVGIFVWRAGVWRGWLEIAPFLVGIILALFMAGLGTFFALAGGALIFALSTAAGLFTLALGVYRHGGKEVPVSQG